MLRGPLLPAGAWQPAGTQRWGDGARDPKGKGVLPRPSVGGAATQLPDAHRRAVSGGSQAPQAGD